MARIRSIKPEVRISEKVNSWPIECRYFWVLLWGYCDDFGYGRDNPRLIVADSFPLDDTITAEMVSAWMDLLWQSGVIERFAVGESRYFRVVNWDEHQRISHPAKQVLPTIDEATEVFERVTETLARITEASEKTSPKQGAGSREQGKGAGSRNALSRSSRISPEWAPSDALIEWATREIPGIDVLGETPNFIDYWIAQPGTRGQKADWDATWRTWMRRQTPKVGTKNATAVMGVIEMGRQWQAQEDRKALG